MLRLITLPLSHYCEKVRWALERQDVPFREEGHVPLVHAFYSWPTSGFKSRALPMLADDNAVIWDSTRCLHYLQERHGATWLYAPKEAAGLEEWFDEELGPNSRRFVYFHGLSDTKAMLGVLEQNVPSYEAKLASALFPLIRAAMRKEMNIHEAPAARSLTQVNAVFEAVSARLQDGRPYLCGDAFSAADLTFAALAAPVLLPQNYGVKLPPMSAVPPTLRTQIERFRSTLAGAFVLRLYEQERATRLPRMSASGTPLHA